jgi:hypothetical protein
MTHPVALRRQAERRQRLALAETLAARLDDLAVRAVAVFGSVARGDFNAWSDIDVLVVADDLPERWLDRLGLLAERAPAGVSAMAWTSAEWAQELARHNPIAAEVLDTGVIIRGAPPTGTEEAGRP